MTLFQYIRALNANLRTGSASEGAHRPALVELLETEKGVRAVNEPAQIAGNAPDIEVIRGASVIGFIETKDIGANLDVEKAGEQLTRYRDAFPNLLLTDYLEWIWFVDGAEKERVCIARMVKGKIKLDDGAEKKWSEFVGNFLAWKMPSVAAPQELAKHLAGKTRQLKAVTLALLKEGDREISAQHKTFCQYLVPDISAEEFSDMFAQTISHGIFTARCFGRTGEIFARTRTETLIPESNPLLREFFHHITGPNLSPDLARLVDSITDFLSRVDMRSILETQARKAGFEDPVFHFYETFLAAYDPKLRERRGVYYTPAPVVDFIVRGVDEILRTRFRRAAGLADTKTLILDPAVGTAAFLRRVVEIIRQTVLQQGRGGVWSGYVKDHLLPRIFGFELMMAPYTVAHLKLALQLGESNYEFGKRERLQIFLTNTLDQLQNESGQLMSQWLVDEAKDAEAVKNKKPVMVVLGNPPYSGESATRSQWSKDLIAEYKKEPDGSALKERTAKWLNDDYVKFIGFAQWRVKQTGHGVVAFIANHAWLDNPTFRGMRAALLRDFDEIRIVDLHGNVKKKERGPEGGKEENVFDIQQGVAVLFLIRRESAACKKDATVFHRDLWGTRRGKYDSLGALSVAGGGWEEVKPTVPLLLFKPVNEALRAEYEKGWKVTEIFPINGAGMTTARDHMVIDFEKPPLLGRVSTFRDSGDSDRDLCARLQIPMKKGWNIAKARQNLQEEDRLDDFVKPVLYRPFDWRLIFYHDALVWRTVKKVMRHMQGGKNVGLVTVRQQSQQGTWRHVGIIDQIMEGCAISNKTKEINYLFPLYVYPETDERNGSVDNNRRPNLAPEFLQAVEERIGASPSPEEILHYVYAVLHSPAYRERYADFLKSDFPRLPLTSDKKLFYRLAKLGSQLADAHLMRAPAPANPAVKYPEAGSHKVEKVRHDEKNRRVYINKTQFFAGVPKNDWDFFIGGYQVLDKWLKSRTNRVLSAEEVQHYQRLVAVIQKTRQLMKKVDDAIGTWPMA